MTIDARFAATYRFGCDMSPRVNFVERATAPIHGHVSLYSTADVELKIRRNLSEIMRLCSDIVAARFAKSLFSTSVLLIPHQPYSITVYSFSAARLEVWLVACTRRRAD